MKKHLHIFKSLTLIITIFTLGYAQAGSKDSSLIPQVLYVHSFGQATIEPREEKNSNTDMLLKANLEHDQIIHFTNSQHVKLGGIMTPDKFIHSFNSAAQDKGLNAALIVNTTDSKKFYYILSIKNALYEEKTKTITYQIQVLQSIGLAKSNNEKLLFNDGGVLFIDDACLTCGQ